MSELKPGDEVERYVVQRLLGRGGAAEVYAVEHRLLGTRHALKVLHRTDPRHREQLLEEGRAQALLDPTYVLPVTDVVALSDGLALLMPFVAGCSLESLLERRRFTEQEVVRVIRPVALGVASAHSQKLVHRDLKPSNILVDQQRQRILRDASPVDSLRVRVADFGIVRRSGRAWVPGEKVQGSPAYMSPEVLRGEPADERADLWALGVLLYEMLVGHRPFRALGLNALLDAVRHAPIALDAVPARWQPVVDGLLTRDVAKRTRSVEALLEALPDPPGGADGIERAEQGLLSEVAAVLADSQPQPVASSFVGREAELDALHRLIDHGERVVSVRGPGGVGKSALLEQYASQTTSRWPGGVVHCSLAEADGVVAIGRSVLDAMAAPLAGDPSEQVASVLAAQPRTLVVLDEAEHLVTEVAEQVSTWVARCPDVVFLIGSRVRMEVGRGLTLGPLSRADARALFEARIRAARGGAELESAERTQLDVILKRLENIPLALELAAARAAGATLHELARGLESGLDQTHPTLQACLEWSFSLLAPVEASVLIQLSVFVGGCSIEAACSVVEVRESRGLRERSDDAVRQALSVLADQSLLTRDGDRVRVLESTRRLARTKLDPGMRRALAARHATWFARFGSWEWLVEPDHWDDDLEPRADRENIRVALQYALDAEAPLEPPVLAGLAQAYARIAIAHGPMAEAADFCRAVFGRLESGQNSDTTRLARTVVGLYLSELLLLMMGRPEQVAWFEALVTDLRGMSSADPSLLAFGLRQLGRSLRGAERERAEALLHEALTRSRSTGRVGIEAAARLSYGLHLATHGGREAGLREMKQAESLARAHGCASVLARAMYHLAYQHLWSGQQERARSLAFEGLAVARATGSLYREAAMLILLGDVTVQGDVETAAAWLRKALDLILRLESAQFTSVAYESLAVLEDGRGNEAAAWALFDAAVNAMTWSGGQAVIALPRANRARFHLRHGRFHHAIEDLETVSGRREGGWLEWSDQATLARALARAGEPDRAEQIARSVLHRLGRDEAPKWFVEVQLALGRVALAREDSEALGHAVVAARGVPGHPIQIAERALLEGELARRTRDSDDVDRAVEALRVALDNPVPSAFERDELQAVFDHLSAPRTRGGRGSREIRGQTGADS